VSERHAPPAKSSKSSEHGWEGIEVVGLASLSLEWQHMSLLKAAPKTTHSAEGYVGIKSQKIALPSQLERDEQVRRNLDKESAVENLLLR
jgi:hypothetical protein